MRNLFSRWQDTDPVSQGPGNRGFRPPDLAVALRYRPGTDNAPILTAKGRKGLALRMIQDARFHNVPVIRDPELASLLDGLKSGVEIPDNLYRAIVEIFAFIKHSGSSR